MILGAVREAGSLLSRFTERWVPDSWVICMILTALALLLAVGGAGAGVEEALLAWGDGVWVLLTLAMQFTIAMVASHACVSSRPVFRLLDRHRLHGRPALAKCGTIQSSGEKCGRGPTAARSS